MPRDWSEVVARFVASRDLTEAERAAVEAFVAAHVDGKLVTIDTQSWSTFSDAPTLRIGDEPEVQTEEAPRPPPATDGERYVDLGTLGIGGMGEVLRVRDLALNRIVAMKVMRADWVGRAAAEARFVAEAQATAQLQHPGVVPVHDLGRLPDGRWFFTMKEVRGRSLTELLAEAREKPDRWPLRRLLEPFRAVCEAVAYAHARGAVHRDLKPDNVLLGDFGEVVVLDWGLVKATGASERPIATAGWTHETRAGAILGTPTYMAPEQAAGASAEAGPAADVYALGAILYELLAGRPPYRGEPKEIVAAVRRGAPEPLPAGIPDELAELVRNAMERDPDDRPPDAAALIDGLSRWLDGQARRDRALKIVAEADALQPVVEGALSRAARFRAEARRLRQEVPSWAGLDQKRAIWEREDGARAAQREADLNGLHRLQLLRAALTEDPDLVEARERLAYVYHWCHERAEEQGDEDGVRQYDLLLREYDTGEYSSYLAGNGRLTLHAEPVRAKATLYRLVERDRRLVPELERELGPTPLLGVPIPMGSWLVELSAPGRATIRVPVFIGRQQHWDGVPPGALHPAPIWLPGDRELGLDDVYVPGGWALLGGDPSPPDPTPPRRVWVEPFVIQRFPVTNADWIRWLDWLVKQGREAEALSHAPRLGRGGRILYGRAPDGSFQLGVDDDGDPWLPDHPVSCVTLQDARAYAGWLEERTGVPWRLPWEAEWEKAARGVDGRPFVTGQHLDPTWANVRGCTRDILEISTIDAYPLDESVYGVRGMTGGVHELCNDRWDGEQLKLAGDRPVFEAGDPGGFAVLRGGSRASEIADCRVDRRLRLAPHATADRVGLRLARSLDTGRTAQRGLAWRFGG